MLKAVIAFVWLIASSFCVLAQSPISAFPPGMFQNRSAMSPAPVTYQGQGDVVSGATVWGSCARVYTVALANTSTSLCDLVAFTGGAAVCTLRGSASGFVDLAASYCAGTTPSAACAAASGGSCKITKIYDQTGNGNHWTQATLASMPALTFNAINGLPGMTCAGACNIQTTTTITQSAPYSYSYVAVRTGSFTTQQAVLTQTGGAGTAGFSTSANTAFMVSGGTAVTPSATDSSFHAFQALFVSGAGTMVVDGTATSGSPGANGLTSNFRLMTASGTSSSLTGTTMEAGMWPSQFNATQYGNLNSNQHGSSGYNF